jgi:hypothetical protein
MIDCSYLRHAAMWRRGVLVHGWALSFDFDGACDSEEEGVPSGKRDWSRGFVSEYV